MLTEDLITHIGAVGEEDIGNDDDNIEYDSRGGFTVLSRVNDQTDCVDQVDPSTD